MAPDFSQTTRALGADRGVARAVVLVLLVLLVAWGGWLAQGQVTLIEASDQARVQAEGLARLRLPLAGEVVAQPVRLGDRVEVGDVLLRLDQGAADLEVAVAAARVAALEAQLAARAEARDAQGASLAAATGARVAAQAAARASLAEATLARDAARRALGDAQRLYAARAISASALDEAESALGAAQAQVAAAEAAVRGAVDQTTETTQSGTVQAAQARVEDEAVVADLATAQAALRQAEEQRDRHVLRAPVAGHVGELVALLPGQSVAADTLIAVVVPDGELVVAARFSPEHAAGRLQAGQSARVRIVGAGGQGSRAARVREVGSEPGTDGLVGVVLELLEPSAALHHGLVAEVEVTVEVVSPAEVLMRAAGGGA